MLENIDLIGSYGFPIVVTAYLLYERSKFNARMIETMEHITTVLENLERRLE